MARTFSYDFATISPVYPNGLEPSEKESTRKTHTTVGSLSSSTWWPHYPSWLPQRPSGPQPPPTRPSTADMDEIQEIPVTPLSSDYGRIATPRSVRILGKPSTHPRHQETDETEVAGETTTFKASRRSRLSWSRPRRPRFRAPGLRLEQLESPSLFVRIQYITLPIIVFAHLIIQTYLDLNAVYILIQVTKFPSPSSITPASNRTWSVATTAYIFCWVIQIFGIFILYELVYSFYRRWRTKRPLVAPLYLSAPAHSLVSITSYRNFCFFRFIRRSAFGGAPGDHSGNWKDGWAERCFFFSQNFPTIATLLPRAALCLSLLFTFTLPSTGVASGVAPRDPTFFHMVDGTLTAYARGVLIANAVWTAWRTLIVLGSICGLWLLSGKACAGLCGPRHRCDEEDEREERATQSLFGSGWEGVPERFDPLGWSWRERTHGRIRYAWEFCLTSLPEKRVDSVATEKRTVPVVPTTLSTSLPVDELNKMLSSAGYPEPPTPAKRRDRTLPQDFFEERTSPTSTSSSPTSSPTSSSPAQELSDILPPVASSPIEGKGKDGPLMKLPHPFTAAGSSSPKGSKTAPDPFAAGSTNVPFPFTVYEDTPRSPGSPELPTQQSRLSQYEESTDEDIENEIIGAFEATGSEEEPQSTSLPQPASGRTSSSLSSLGRPLPRSSSLYSFTRRSPGERPSEGEVAEVPVTVESASSESHLNRKDEVPFPPPPRPRQRARTGPPTVSSASSESYHLSPPRHRTTSGISKASGKRGEPQPEPEPESIIISESGLADDDEVEAAEREDSVGLLSTNVSPRSSLGRTRKRSLSFGGRRSNGSRSASESTHSGSNGSSSSPNSANGSFRIRTQSLVQAALAPMATARSRSRSHSSSLVPPGRISEERHPDSTSEGSVSVDREDTFGQPLPWVRRLEIASEQAGSGDASHSRQASSGSSSSVPGRNSGEGDFTFGQPLPVHIRHPEQFGSQSVRNGHGPEKPSPEN